MGTGTIGFAHHSNQTALGVKGLSELLLNGYDQGCDSSMQLMLTDVIRMWPRR